MSTRSIFKTLIGPVVSSLDSWAFEPTSNKKKLTTEDWTRCIPYILMHLACLFVFVVGWSPFAILFAVGFYFLRMFAITGFYHRYFSHRSFKTSRWMQFLMALLGSASVQRGPIWWAAHHRHHHMNADKEDDTHSPEGGRRFWWSHTSWFMAGANYPTRKHYVKDWLRYPELVFLDRFDTLVPILTAAAIYGLGEILPASFGTSGWQLLIWGFFISTVVLYHGTFTINSFGHLFGTRRYETNDDSRNNWSLVFITLGEGWHNNHHRYPYSARQGFRWWEVDITYYVLKAMSWLRLVHDLRPVPQTILKEAEASPRRKAA